ncbi:hypothetical protein ACHHYP_08957 [Achlya hypogyna]|uniref:TFIIS N-terminal domain-containing protein n=1 Tax=Achlya hypogyna TaxID=1202772 RepID=A0A1V9ZJW5_ACHHY|nr:hypothetical protein ACHHYP_08957 [Achlya hypogyna]
MGWTFTEVHDVARKLHDTIGKEGWKSDTKNTKDLQLMLSNLQSYRPDHESLAKTKIGVAVNKLRKHTDQCISAYANILTNRWKEALDLKPASAPVSSRPVGNAPEPSKIDSEQREVARNRLAMSYAEHKAKRDARTSIYLDAPVTKTKRGKAQPSKVTITRFANPQRAQAKIVRSMAPTGPNSARPSASRTTTDSRAPAKAPPRTNSALSQNMTDEERHRLRQQRLRAIAEEKARQMGKAIPPALRDASKTQSSNSKRDAEGNSASTKRDAGNRERAPPNVDPRKMYTRISEPEGRPAPSKPAPKARSSSNAPPMTKQQAERKAFLDKMYPRVASTAPENPLKRKRDDKTADKAPEKKPWSTGEREVVHWLKGMAEDMSQYSQTFFDNGFDSMKIVSTLTEKDIASMVPKRGHCRIIEMALAATQKKVQRPPMKKRAMYDEDEYESDDSFVVNDDDDGYVPGAISSLIFKNRRGSHKYAHDEDDYDSSDMEATYDDIAREEARSRMYGDYEDEREARREREHKLKKEKRKKK